VKEVKYIGLNIDVCKSKTLKTIKDQLRPKKTAIRSRLWKCSEQV
jgi:hypothetical protein